MIPHSQQEFTMAWIQNQVFTIAIPGLYHWAIPLSQGSTTKISHYPRALPLSYPSIPQYSTTELSLYPRALPLSFPSISQYSTTELSLYPRALPVSYPSIPQYSTTEISLYPRAIPVSYPSIPQYSTAQISLYPMEEGKRRHGKWLKLAHTHRRGACWSASPWQQYADRRPRVRQRCDITWRTHQKLGKSPAGDVGTGNGR